MLVGKLVKMSSNVSRYVSGIDNQIALLITVRNGGSPNSTTRQLETVYERRNNIPS